MFADSSSASPSGGADASLKDGTNNQHLIKKSTCLDKIEQLKQNREERRKKMSDQRKMKTDRELMNEAQGIKVDVDFQVLIENNKSTVVQRLPVITQSINTLSLFCYFLIIMNFLDHINVAYSG